MRLANAKLGFGSLVCVPAYPEIQRTHEADERAANINSGTPARDAYCDVRFMVTCEYFEDGRTADNLLVTVRLRGDKSDLPYSEVEAEASRLVAPMLREVADRIEKQVADYDESRRGELSEA